MIIPLWEWAVFREVRDAPVGVSMTRHGAMEALARALIETGRPSRGRVFPVLLTESVHESAFYVRLPVWHTAIYDGQRIQWA